MQKKNNHGMLMLIFVNVMWGLSFIASKVAMSNGFEPFSLILVRYILTTLLLYNKAHR